MTGPEYLASRAGRILAAVLSSRFTLWIAFVLVHLVLGLINLYGPGLPLGDVTIMYKFWSDQVLSAHYWVGVDGPFVYPVLAIFPMLAASSLGPAVYASTWLSLVMILNCVAFAWLTGWGRTGRNIAAGWWWVAFLLLLGPIALGRIDSITVPLAIVGMLLVVSRPVAGAFILTIATWIKVWPAALLAAIVIAHRQRATVVTWAVIASAGIVAISLTYGSGSNILSFVTQQAGRGLQVEAPISTPWLWAAAAGVPGAFVYYNQDILTYQVTGPAADVVSLVMTPLLAIAALATSALGILAARRKPPVTELLPVLALALVSCLIAFNKVGSPQFMSWLAVPVLFGLVVAASGHGRSFRTPAVLTLVIGGLTHVLYPYLYASFLGLNAIMLIIDTARNVLIFVLFGWAIAALWDLWRNGDWLPEQAGAAEDAASAWPFSAHREGDDISPLVPRTGSSV